MADEVCEPEEPSPSDCCGSGCSPCVYDIYLQQMKRWRTAKSSLTPRSEDSDFGMSICQEHYTDAVIDDIIWLTEDCCVVRLKTNNFNCRQVTELCGAHLQMRWPTGLSAVRPYTPVLLDGYPVAPICFFVKLYEGGQMSKAWKSLEVGHSIQLRGPWGGFPYKPNQHKLILLLAAGTGLAPVHQLTQRVLNNEDDETSLQLLYSVKTANRIYGKQQLDEFSSFWNFRVTYFITQASTPAERDMRYGDTVCYHRITQGTLHSALGPSGGHSVRVLICGTDSFCTDMRRLCKELPVPAEHVFVF